MLTPKTLLINGAERRVHGQRTNAQGASLTFIDWNGVSMAFPLPADFGPGHVVNLNSLFIRWGS